MKKSPSEKNFDHIALKLNKNKQLIYTAMSKYFFYNRMFISKYVLEQNAVPLNPFMVFDYFLLDSVDRNLIREANNNLVIKSDEIWVFGPISNGVLSEIILGKSLAKPIRYFSLQKSTIIRIDKGMVEFEEEVKKFKDTL